jgi:hypothetical protein
MNTIRLQNLLTAKFEGDHVRIARMQHFIGLLRTGLDGLATLGVVIKISAEGLESPDVAWQEPENTLESLEKAIAFMQGASKNVTD